MSNAIKNLVPATLAAVMLFILLAGCQAFSDPQEATDSTYGSSPSAATQATKPNGNDEETKSAQKPDPSKPDGTKDSAKPDSSQSSTGDSENPGGSTAPSTPAKPSEPPKQNDPAPSNPTPSNPAPTNPPHTHSYKAVQTVKPTCNTKGYTVYKCSCGDSYQSDEVPATGHSWGDWVVTIEPTVEAEGRRTKTCSVCGMTESQDIPKLDPPPTTPSTPVSLNMRDVEAAVLKYINQFRNEQGAGSLSYRSDMTAFSQYRASQLIYNFAHDRNDQAAAADATKYGIYDKATGHYQFLGSEAICWTGINPDYTADYIGLRIATAWYESASHWNYVGNPMMVFAGVGCAQGSDGNVYACIIVFDEYLDDQLNLDYSSQP